MHHHLYFRTLLMFNGGVRALFHVHVPDEDEARVRDGDDDVWDHVLLRSHVFPHKPVPG